MDDRQQPTSERWAVCLDDSTYPGELQVRKMYEILPDPDAGDHDQIRVIDESGEDYLYPKSIFLEIEVSTADAEVIRRAC
jgi:hypothetical protein